MREQSSDNTAKSSNTDLLDLVRTLIRWRKVIVYTCLAAGLGAVVIALLLPVYYQASTTFLVASPDQANPALIFGKDGTSPLLYGGEMDIDRILTIGESNELVDFLVDSFRLYEDYNVDVDSPLGMHYLRKAFRGDFELVKTKRDALQLSVEHRNPEKAAAIARAAREKINQLAQNVVKGVQGRTIATFEADIANKEQQLNVLSDSLRKVRETYGIYSTEAQSESLTSQLASTESALTNYSAQLEAFKVKGGRFRDSVAVYEVRIEGLQKEFEQLNEKLGHYNEGLSGFYSYTRQYQEANNALSENKEKLKQYRATYNSDIPAIMLVEEASVPLIKSRPFRSVIVLGSVLVTFVLLIAGILLFEAYKSINWRSVYDGE